MVCGGPGRHYARLGTSVPLPRRRPQAAVGQGWLLASPHFPSKSRCLCFPQGWSVTPLFLSVVLEGVFVPLAAAGLYL